MGSSVRSLSARGLIDENDLPFETVSENLGPIRIPDATMVEPERYAILKTLEANGQFDDEDGRVARHQHPYDLVQTSRV
jgi:hypothetical protein